MSPHRIAAVGCDGSTEVTLDLTDEEAATVRKVADAITETGGGCDPTLHIAAPGEDLFPC